MRHLKLASLFVGAAATSGYFLYKNWQNFSFKYMLPKKIKPEVSFDQISYDEIDYSQIENWAGHPHVINGANKIPKGLEALTDEVAVFYVHPTAMIPGKYWNADLSLLKATPLFMEKILPFQAGLFSIFGEVYAPFYRQASIYTIFEESGEDGIKALDRAYQDVVKAFTYFVDNFLQGRPFVLVGHSQGANHAMRLLEEEIHGKEIEKNMLCAYVPGAKVAEKVVTRNGVGNVGEIFTWNTFLKNGKPSDVFYNSPIFVDDHYERNDSKGICKLPKPDGQNYYTSFVPGQGLVKGPSIGIVKDGVWFISKPENGALTSVVLANGWLHIHDMQYPWAAIQRDVMARLKAYKEGRTYVEFSKS